MSERMTAGSGARGAAERSLMELALDIEPKPAPDRSPPEEEAAIAWALCSAALRQGDEARLARLLDDFGYLPDPRHSPGAPLLRQSAALPSAPAYEELAQAAWRAWMDGQARRVKGFDPEAPENLSVFLRYGLINEISQLSPQPGRVTPQREIAPSFSTHPIAAALAEDSPLALAKALSIPGWREALAAAEPAEQAGLEALDMDSERLRALAEKGVFAERCLLSNAMSQRAPRCARFLLRLPEFSQALLRERLPAVQEPDETRLRNTRMMEVLAKAMPHHPAMISSEKAFESVERRGYSFFERALRVMGQGKNKELWAAVIDEAIESVEIELARPQSGTGRGWAEMIAWSPAKEASDLVQAQRWIERLSERGARVDWNRVSRMLSESRLPEARMLSDWAALNGQSLGGGQGSRSPRI